jgi:hypothetical protein
VRRAWASSVTALRATLTVVIATSTITVSLIIMAAPRRGITAEIRSITTTARRSASAPSTIGRSGSRTVTTKARRRLHNVAISTVTHFAWHGDRSPPRLLALGIRIRDRRWWCLGRGKVVGGITARHALNQSRNLVKGDSLVREGLYQQNLLLRGWVKSRPTRRSRRRSGIGIWGITGTVGHGTRLRAILAIHLGKRKGQRRHGYRLRLRLRLRRI